MKDYETERARQEQDSLLAARALLAALAVFVLVVLLAWFGPTGRLLLVLAVLGVVVLAAVRHVRDHD